MMGVAGSSAGGTVAGCSGSAGVPGSGSAGVTGSPGAIGPSGSEGFGTSALVLGVMSSGYPPYAARTRRVWVCHGPGN
jgi:hypothetical protein